jgi:hypothetical protein
MRVPLNEGAYEARSVIASAQRAVNLYPELNPPDAECKYTHYNSPGLSPLGTAPNQTARCLYWANNGTLYYLAGRTLYTVSTSWALTAIGTVGTASGIASMADNGTTLVLVDGSANGYQVNLTTNAFSAISAATNSPPVGSGSDYAFYGATRVDVIDGFLVFNSPGTRTFYCTYENEVVFDALYFADKNGYSDNLVTLIVTRREIWLLGQRTTEIWYDAGNSAFPFAIMPGPFIPYGAVAAYSVAQVDGAIFWLSEDQSGQNILMRGEGYAAKRISTHALEQEWEGYSTTTDAIGFCFQFGGHAFYQINFPTANKSWRWDEATGLWHEPVYTDANGVENMHLVQCAAFAYGVNVGADATTGQLYQIDPDVYTDNGSPMYFRRGYPHMMIDGRRAIYPGFTLDVECATSPDTINQPGPFPMLIGGAYAGSEIMEAGTGFGLLSGPAPINTSPQVLLRWSDTRGRTWSEPVPQSLGATGEYLAQPKWSRTGMGRDRVFEVFGVIPGRLAINGAFLDPEPIKLNS